MAIGSHRIEVWLIEDIRGWCCMNDAFNDLAAFLKKLIKNGYKLKESVNCIVDRVVNLWT